MALDENGQVIDKFRGLIDLEQKRLRAVGKAEERFEEDALRIMRGFRFAASLDFDIEAATFEAMRSHSPLLEKISVERSFTEFDKLLMAPHWRKGISAMIACQAYDYLPGLKQREAGLNHLIVSLKDNFTFSDHHQAWAYVMISLAIEDPKSFLKAWKTSNDFQRYVTKLIALYRIRQERSFEKLDIYQYGKEMASLVEGLRKAQSLSVDMDHIEALDQALAIHNKHDIVLNGSHLIKDFGMEPGPQLGLMLEKVELAIVEGCLDNDFTTIEAFVREELAT